MAPHLEGIVASPRRTTTAAPALSMQEAGSLLFRDQSQRLRTKSKFDNLYGCGMLVEELSRHEVDAAGRGRVEVWRVGKGAAGTQGQGARVVITEIDPI